MIDNIDIYKDMFTKPVEEKTSIAEVLHENTKLYPGKEYLSLGPKDFVDITNRQIYDDIVWEIEELVSTGGKTYENSNKIFLPDVENKKLGALKDALVNRSSVRDFSSDPLTDEQIACILKYGYGLNISRWWTEFTMEYKHVPSSGRLYPLEIYIACINASEDRLRGVHHYNARRHILEQIGTADEVSVLPKLLTQPEIGIKSGAVLFLTGVLPRLTWKYSERAYRYLLLEAGHAGQNICLVGAALGLGICPLGGFFDDLVHDFLRIDGVSETNLYAFAIGNPI